MMYLAPNKSSLDVAAGFATSVRASTVRLPSGCPKLIWPYKMRVNSVVILTRQQPLPVFRAIAWYFGRRSLQIAARRFRQKLLRRPVALRGNSEKVQPNTLYKVVVRYLTGTPLSPGYPVTQLMKPDQLLPQNAHEQIEALAKEIFGAYAPWVTGIVPRTALAVLWLATHRHEVESMVAQGLVEAAGLRGKQNWALILSSSARVSKVSYAHVTFGNYLADWQARVGGFLDPCNC